MFCECIWFTIIAHKQLPITFLWAQHRGTWTILGVPPLALVIDTCVSASFTIKHENRKKTLFTIILFVNSMFPAHPRPSCNPLMPLSLRTQGLVQKVIKQWQWSCIIIAFFILHHNNVVWRKIMVGLKVFLLESHYSRLTHLRTTRSEKNIFSCIQQFIETDTFSQMKILQRFSLPGTTYFWHLHLKTVKHLLRLFSSLEADQLNFTLWKRTIFNQLKFFNSLASGCFRGFSEKNNT